MLEQDIADYRSEYLWEDSVVLGVRFEPHRCLLLVDCRKPNEDVQYSETEIVFTSVERFVLALTAEMSAEPDGGLDLGDLNFEVVPEGVEVQIGSGKLFLFGQRVRMHFKSVGEF